MREAGQVDTATRVAPYAWFVLLLLTAAYSLNWMDRYVIVILIEPIRRSLHFSDTELGILTGFSYSLVYSLMGIPLGRLADRSMRKRVLSGAVGLWSLFTALTGLARGFPSLAMAHASLAASQAGCSPPAYSLISAYFPAHRRGTAIAIYSLGISFGIWMALALGGWLNTWLGWRMVFAVFSLPGFVLAALIYFTVKEPKISTPVEDALATSSPPESGLAHILRQRTLLAIMLALGLFSFSGSGFEMWTPAYLIRSLHMNTQDVGRISGLIEGIAGIVGTLFTGVLADFLGNRDQRWYLWLPLGGALLTIPAEWIFLFAGQDGRPIYLFYFIAILGASSYMAPMMALGQTLLPERLRGLGAASMLLVLNIVGTGAGSFFVGVTSDFLHPTMGEHALRQAIMLASVSIALGTIGIWYASKNLSRDLARNEQRVENV